MPRQCLDLRAEAQVLPPYEVVIFDEAHQIEELTDALRALVGVDLP